MKTIGKKLVIVLILFLAGVTMTSCHQQSSSVTNTMSTSQLLDKIKGGWAGQTIGVSFGSHTEFRYQGTFIQDYQSIPCNEGYVQELMDSWPDLYDDIYMDGDYDWDRYNSDPDYADGVDDAMDEFDDEW